MKVNRPWVKEYKQQERTVDNSKFYNSRTWRKTRKLFLENNPLCIHCERLGVTTPANVVDHIIPISEGGDKLNTKNLQPLCKKCHEKKSASESAKKRGMGKKLSVYKRCTSHDSQNFTHE
ncbi:HNH endonuclease [Nonlabens sp. SCSIO 43208]|uniref:HNH endonuclease n=1 Tax=Nonlabens sp. SCSIO 43208 TaxID=2793009 RepID=UPI003D6AA98F